MVVKPGLIQTQVCRFLGNEKEFIFLRTLKKKKKKKKKFLVSSKGSVELLLNMHTRFKTRNFSLITCVFFVHIS